MVNSASVGASRGSSSSCTTSANRPSTANTPSTTSVLTVRFSCTSRTPTQGLGPWSIVTCFVVGTCVTSADDEGGTTPSNTVAARAAAAEPDHPRRAMVCQPSFNVNPGQLGFVDLRRSD